MRKTIEIERIKEMVNNRNIHSKCDKKVREGWNSFLESILHETGNYSGFHYLREYELENGVDPGIIFDPINHNHEYPDDSRRIYF